MPTFYDHTGKRFGKLLVVAYAGTRYWKCVCDCGVEKNIRASHLTGEEGVRCCRGCPLETYDRFLASVDRQPDDGCWLWTANVMKNGYGYFCVRGKEGSAHRYSYEKHTGPIAPGLHVCHRCDVPRCVNPSHLFLGTPKDNTADMVAKGRYATPKRLAAMKLVGARKRGSRHPLSKLTNLQREGIASRLLAGGCTKYRLAKEYGVSQKTIARAVMIVSRDGVPL